MSKTFLPAGLVALFLAVAPARPADKDAGNDALNLAGEYAVVAGEKFGQKEPEDRIKGTKVRFTADRIVVTDKQKETYVATYKVDRSKKPHTITMTGADPSSQGMVAKGLIEKDGDTVRLVYALPGGEMPKDFTTKDKQLLFVLKATNK
jgi:uncharacterized protein (TIGR03067 family)